VYYGSTTQKRVCNRISSHNAEYKGWKLGKHHFVTSFLIIDTGDWDYMTVEKVMHDEPFELRNRERYWIENNKCVNKCVPNTTPKESRKKWSDQNKEKLAEYKKDYQKQNKEIIEEYRKEKVTCECGCIVRRDGLGGHKKLKKHLDKIKGKNG
jgi:hypothetical protein